MKQLIYISKVMIFSFGDIWIYDGARIPKIFSFGADTHPPLVKKFHFFDKMERVKKKNQLKTKV